MSIPTLYFMKGKWFASKFYREDDYRLGGIDKQLESCEKWANEGVIMCKSRIVRSDDSVIEVWASPAIAD
jgi:hypothetical protein